MCRAILGDGNILCSSTSKYLLFLFETFLSNDLLNIPCFSFLVIILDTKEAFGQ